MTIMLQAGFILVLCASFYQVISFYTRTQQVLTARNHAERVISFMDDKIRNAGLGLWRCGNSEAIRAKLTNIAQLATNDTKGYKLPVSLKWLKDGLSTNTDKVPKLSLSQNAGDVLTLLYAQRDLSSGDDQLIPFTASPLQLTYQNKYGQIYWGGSLQILDRNNINKFNSSKTFELGNIGYIKGYAVMEAMGYPIHLRGIDKKQLLVQAFGFAVNPSLEEITIPAASEIIGLNCMQMYVRDKNDGHGRQFAYRELKDDSTGWNGTTYNQEKGILDIYMEVDRDKNIFTLWVLATGGYDASMNNPRPDTWPDNANPRLAKYNADNTQSPEDAKTAWLASDYCHHIVYVSRATWKLNNIPPNFGW